MIKYSQFRNRSYLIQIKKENILKNIGRPSSDINKNGGAHDHNDELAHNIETYINLNIFS